MSISVLFQGVNEITGFSFWTYKIKLSVCVPVWVHMCICMCVSMCVSVCMCVHTCAYMCIVEHCGGKRTVSGVDPLLPCSRKGLFCCLLLCAPG